MSISLQFDDSTWLPLRLWLELVKYRADYKCEDCGKQFEFGRAYQYETRLTAHHKDGDKTNNVLSNGKSLCGKCHRREHVRMGPSNTHEVRSHAMKKAWETRRRNGTVNSRFARMTSEELAEKNRKSAATTALTEPRQRDVKGRYT